MANGDNSIPPEIVEVLDRIAKNGSGKNITQQLAEMLLKQGSWAVLSAVLLYAFWVVALEPAYREREIFVETLRENSQVNRVNAKENCDTMKQMAQTNEEIRDSVVAQQQTLIEIKDEVKAQSKLRKVAMDTMGAFAKRVEADHPKQQETLDEILEEVKKP